MTYPLSAIAVVLLTSLPALSLAGQGTADADLKEIQAYKLSVPAMKQFIVATRNMMAAIKQDPRYAQLRKLQAELKTLEDKEEPTEADERRTEQINAEIEKLESTTSNAMSGSQSLSEMARGIEKEPTIAAALKSAGMSPRDYAKFSLAFFQASMVHGMQKSGMVKQVPAELQAQISMDNIKSSRPISPKSRR